MNNETKKIDEILDEQLNQTELEQLKGGTEQKHLEESKNQDGGNGSSNCCNSGW